MLWPATAKVTLYTGILGLAVMALALPHGADGPEASTSLEGPEVKVGNGTARLVVELDPYSRPRTVGIILTEAALTGLATRMNTTSRCFDKNGDGAMTHGECLGDYQADLALPPLRPAWVSRSAGPP